jgi:BirA family transcriptional regulator, biotin operon repressor / biotin---[acetyl-CoA-carboxylase] ligase
VIADPAGRPPLDAQRLATADPDLLPGVTVEVVEEAGSTNALVSERAREGAPEGLVVAAEHQVAGRGRLDRTWETPARSALTFSLLLRPTAPVAAWPWLPLLVGYAVSKALTAAGHDAVVKWPNDVLLGDGRKVAGILVERVETTTGPAAVVGVGINVGMTAEELPVPEATSLAVAADGDPPDRTDLLVGVLASLLEAYAAWQEGGEAAAARLAESYSAACATIGSAVRVALPSGEDLTGTATGIDASGRLLVESPGEDGTGVQTAVSAGDVVHVRGL